MLNPTPVMITAIICMTIIIMWAVLIGKTTPSSKPPR